MQQCVNVCKLMIQNSFTNNKLDIMQCFCHSIYAYIAHSCLLRWIQLLLRTCYVKALYKHCPKKEIRTRSVNKSLCFLFFHSLFVYFEQTKATHTHSGYIIYFHSMRYILLEMYGMVCSRNVSTRPITIHADMFAVYWNDAFRTTRKRLPDSGDAAHTHTHTHPVWLQGGWYAVDGIQSISFISCVNKRLYVSVQVAGIHTHTHALCSIQ